MANVVISLRISLDAKTWREIDISSAASLYDLAEIINKVFGFDFDHSFGFYDNLKNVYKSKIAYELFADMGEGAQPGAKSVKKTTVLKAFPSDNSILAFLFDYGDDWIFKVERQSMRVDDAPKSYWKMTKSKGDAPPQYPEPEDDEDDRPFAEKYEMKNVNGLTIVELRKK